MKNPYTLQFGKEPKNLISRASQIAEIEESFREDDPVQQVYMITGVRGAGKTVLMTEIAKRFRDDKEWIVVELNPRSDLLKEMAAKLSSENTLAEIFQRAKINLSFFGIGLEVTGSVPITNIETALEKMLDSLKKRGKHVLITIDEVTNTEEMGVFAGAFQIFVRHELPVFLVMTGLYENIDALQNEENLTFLYRAARIDLKPLNLGVIAGNYEKAFNIKPETAKEMARLTRGYPYGFQALGYFTWENKGDYTKALDQYKQLLDERAYEKLWSEMSAGDRRIAYGIAKSKSGKTSEIREILSLKPNEINPYRKRLMRKGIVNGDERGVLKFTLPLFESYVMDNYDLVI